MSACSVSELIVTDESGFACSKGKLVESGLVHLRPFNISSDGRLDLSTQYQVPVAEAPAGKTTLLAGDILFNNTNSVELVGKSAYVEADMTAGFSNHLTRIRVNQNKVEPRYFFFWLQHKQGAGFFSSQSTQWVSQAAFKTSELKQQEMSVPSLPEQRRIVDLLARAEGIVRLRREAAAKAAELIPALFIHHFGDPATNPMGWPVEPVASVGRVQLGRQRTPKYQTGKFTRPYVRVANVYEDRIDVSDLLSMDFDERDFATYRLEFGDILLNEGQSIELVGRPAMWRNEVPDCCFQNTLVRFQVDRSRVIPEYMLAALLERYRSGALSRISSKTSNVAHLGAARFAKLPVMVPSLDVQERFRARAQLAESIKKQQATALAKAQSSFDALLAQAFAPT